MTSLLFKFGKPNSLDPVKDIWGCRYNRDAPVMPIFSRPYSIEVQGVRYTV